jgi:hypothetical protein
VGHKEEESSAMVKDGSTGTDSNTDSASESAYDLTSAITAVRTDSNHFELVVPRGWRQGRGAFGGLVLGALTKTLLASEDDRGRTLRSLSGEIVGPVLAGPASIVVTPLRRGSGVSTYRSELTQEGKTLACATGVLGRARTREERTYVAAPSGLANGWADLPSVDLGPPSAPEFLQHFEIRNDGAAPFSGANEPVASGWLRPRKALASYGPAEIVAMADVWWPCGLVVERLPRPAATIAFTLQNLVPDRALDPNEPLYHRARGLAARDGFVVEQRELFTKEGELVAMNQQTIVWI